MVRLPIPGADDGVWGDLLNEFLNVEHNADGTLKKGDLIDGAQQLSQKGAAGGYAALNIDGVIPTGQMGSGTANSTTFLRGDNTWATVSGVSDATTSTKGIIRLTGDLGGTADSPTVPGLAAKANDDTVVKLAGNQSIDGIKTFTSGVVVPDDSITQAKVNGLEEDLAAKQPIDSDLTAIAGLSPADNDIMQRKSGAWTNRTLAQFKTDLALTKSDVGLTNVDNTSDANKPVSNATQTALDGKVDESTLTTKGDLFVATGAGAITRVGVGGNDQVLTADSSTGTGVKWAEVSASGGSGFLHKANGTASQVNLDDGAPHSIVPATYTVPAGTFAANGDTVIVWIAGIAYNYSGGTRYFDLILDVDGVQVTRRLDEFDTNSQDNYFEAVFRIERRAADKFRVFSRINRSRFNPGPSAGAFGAYIVADASDRTLDMTQDITLDVQGDSFDAASGIAIYTQSWSVEKTGAA